MAIECQHGRLARKCELCEYEEEMATLRATVEALREAIKKAPHTRSCEVRFSDGPQYVAGVLTPSPCNCWKRAALKEAE